jgi:hypothetical protein
LLVIVISVCSVQLFRGTAHTIAAADFNRSQTHQRGPIGASRVGSARELSRVGRFSACTRHRNIAGIVLGARVCVVIDHVARGLAARSGKRFFVHTIVRIVCRAHSADRSRDRLALFGYRWIVQNHHGCVVALGHVPLRIEASAAS